MGRRFCIITVCCILSLPFASRVSAEVRLIPSSETAAELYADNYRVKLRLTPDPAMTVWSLLKNGQREQIGSFPLQGFVRSSDDLTGNNVSAPEFIRASKETTNDGLLFTILYGFVGGDQHKVTLRFDRSFFSYELSVVKGHTREITELLYLASNENEGDIKYGKGSFEEFHTWAPDLYDVLIPNVGLSRVSLPPRLGRDDPGYIRGQQAGSPLVGPYVVAVRSGKAWWGVGTVGIPNTYGGLGLIIGRSSFAASYQTASQISAQANTITGPVLGFYFGDDADEILTKYRGSLSPLKGSTSSTSAPPSWWSRPIYCSWGDQVYAARIEEGRLDESNGSRYATEKDLDRWLEIAAREKLPIGTVILDLGWMSDYGDFEPNPKHFSDLRAYIDKLHAKGLHLLLWIPMYEATGTLFNLDKSNSEVAARHPEWLVRTREGKLTDIFDYTNPDMRSYLRSRIHYLLSSDPGALNADGLKVDFIDRLPDPAVSTFHDPSWGIGEAMQAKVLEFIYNSAKEAKADALVDSSFMNPLFHEWQDLIRLNDDVSNAVDTYWWRAWTASVNGVRLIDGDDWWAMERYFVPLTLAKSAWGIPNIYALEHRGNLGTETTSIASGGYPVDISQDAYRKVKAILDVYEHAPADQTQQPTVDPVLQKAGRRYTDGPLKGFYAAQTLNFGRVLVTYRPDSAMLTSVADGDVSVPLPEGFLADKVLAVDFGGKKTPVVFSQQNGCVRFAVKDSAKGTHSYEIKFARHASRRQRAAAISTYDYNLS
jgi:Glycosyl hydrolases family 31